MKTLVKKCRDRMTRKACWWVLRTNLQSWALQGVLVLVLTVAGVGAVAAVVSAKLAAYGVFACQCVNAARS